MTYLDDVFNTSLSQIQVTSFSF